MALIRWTPRKEVWDPFASLADIQDEMNRMFDTSMRRFGTPEGMFFPAVDVSEEGDNLVVKMDLPGLRKEDVSVQLQDNYLIVRGDRKTETTKKEATLYHRERVYGTFSRTLELPFLVEPGKIDAHFRDGVLHITLPKAEEAKPKQIDIKVD